LGEELRQLTTATLVLAGANDEKFVLEARRLADAIPHSRLAVVTGVGHAAHLEAPEVIATFVREFYPQ
jgi:pimeloyl-ACP methyl ester carboxylesterase